jgi:hypothetical protein
VGLLLHHMGPAKKVILQGFEDCCS